MLNKRLRMVLDFEVMVEELTDESLRRYYRPFGNYEDIIGDPELWANVNRQLRLQKALLEDEEALGRFLAYVIVDQVDPRVDSRLGEVFGTIGERVEEEILEPVFGRLGEEDANFFRGVCEGGNLWEHVEVLNKAFVARWTGATLEEVKEVKVVDQRVLDESAE